ncbi:MAG: sensor histidine kinase [Candidatus Aminicenantes bacterium]|jgi:signal transduction histidine kinase
MKRTNGYLVLTQYREGSLYNDFFGKFYHFPKKYLNLLSNPVVEFVYYEPRKSGEGEYYGYGKIEKKPFEDEREDDCYFVEIIDFKPFSKPVPFEDEEGQREKAPYYNPRNLVRRISKETLEEICLDGGIQLNFKSDAHLIKVLGEQLIASEKVGILELIKNAYDAQAGYCKVRIEKVKALPAIDKSLYEFNEYEGPVIVIEDNGMGMTKEVIENGWMRPASTLKTNVKERLKREKQMAVEAGSLGTYESLINQLKKEYKNRIPLGEKGVGRFATHRLGKNLIIKTKVKEVDYEYILKINWEMFDTLSDEAVDLESIGVALTRQKPSRNYGKTNSGTQVIIYGGKEEFDWDLETIENLNRSIERLNSPRIKERKSIEFKVSLECPQIPDLKSEDFLEYFEPIFKFQGLVDEKGILDYSLNFKPPKHVPMPEKTYSEKKVDLRVFDTDYWKEKSGDGFREPKCGSFFLDIDVWYRDRAWYRNLNPKDFFDYLSNFGGISIFRDGINIFPAEWGAETDWLKLKTRHIKQGYRISYYNMIGNLEIDQVNNLELIDKTDREGLIKNHPYGDLVNLVFHIIGKIIEHRFMGKRDDFKKLTGPIISDPKTLREYTSQSANFVHDVSEKYPVLEDPYSILEGFGNAEQRKERLINLERSLKQLQKSLKLINEEKESLTELAGYGLSIAVAVHEITKITSNFYYGVNEILKKKEIDIKQLEELKNSSSSLKTELKRFGPLRAIRGEQKVEFNVSKAVKFVYEVFKRKLKKLNASFEIISDDEFKIYAKYGAVLQVISNLFDNSCYWLETVDKSKRIIQIKIDSGHRTLIVADSGPGIHESILPYLFKIGYSLKTPPSGLGLYICKYYMQDMRGDINLTVSRERIPDMPGAQFTLEFGKVAQSKGENK